MIKMSKKAGFYERDFWRRGRIFQRLPGNFFMKKFIVDNYKNVEYIMRNPTNKSRYME
jgi:hypothetical protein